MRKIRIRKRRVLLGIIVLLFVVNVGASFYFFHVAQIREKKSFTNNNGRSKDSPLYAYKQSFDQLTKETLWMTNQGLKRDAWYVPAETATNRTVTVVHGLIDDREDMKSHAWMFHELGYNVPTPSNMLHEDNEGQIIGYGWNDRLSVTKWAKLLVERNLDSEITLFGVSMGAVTVIMVSGEESLSNQVVNIIEDRGYSSVWDELKYQTKEVYNLPAFPVLYEVFIISKIRTDLSYGQASSVNQLKDNTRRTVPWRLDRKSSDWGVFR